MHSLRPKLSSLYVERPRLLNQLPDDVGYVIHLEAPYGYGKSILAAQYADHLEQQNWRIIWAVVAGKDCRVALATALGVASDSPWQLVIEQLQQEETLLVLEDLEGDEDLSYLLANPTGITLLASRNTLESAEIVKLKTQNLFQHLDATDLALNLQESQALIVEPEQARAVWELTGGWALPLHFSALTGNAPDASSLLAGIKASLDETTWQELLFLAAIDYLPESAKSEESQALVTKGFVQQLESSFRLHHYIATLIFERNAEEVTTIVRQQANRLPLILQGDAYAKCNDDEMLLSILENTDAELWKEHPAKLVAWDKQIEGRMSALRHAAIGAAHDRLGNLDDVIQRLDQVLENTELSKTLSDDETINTARHYCRALAILDNPRGYELITQMEPLFDKVTPECAARFLTNASIIPYYKDDLDYAMKLVQKSLDYFPPNDPTRVTAAINLITYRFEIDADFDLMLNSLIEQIPNVRTHYPVQAVGVTKDIGLFYLWLKDSKQARAYFTEALEQNINSAVGLQAKTVLAYLDKDGKTLSQLVNVAKAYQHYLVNDYVVMFYINHATEQYQHLAKTIEQSTNKSDNQSPGQLKRLQEEIKRTYEQGPKDVLSSAAYSIFLGLLDAKEEALDILKEFDEYNDISLKIYVLAARYVATREAAHLEDFLNITLAGTRVLPGFIPITVLPTTPENTPDLATHYPIEDVLSSGWQEAVQFRKDDIPALELNMLGRFEAKVLGQALELTDRQKQMLCLLCLDNSREEIAEAMWPGIDLKKQRNNLNVQLNLLRKLIEPWGEATYLFEEGLENTISDYTKLQAALSARDADYVLEHYKEIVAPGIHLDAVIELREQLREEVVDLLFDTGLEKTESSYLVRVLDLAPLHEEALQALLKQLHSKGRRREAKQRFDKFANLLKEDMGLEPLDETLKILMAQ